LHLKDYTTLYRLPVKTSTDATTQEVDGRPKKSTVVYKKAHERRLKTSTSSGFLKRAMVLAFMF
jgi:hypothetical protein